MTNRKTGNDFEEYLADVLATNGYWVHNFNLGRRGQPVDLIAIKNGKPTLIEAKHCKSNVFRTSRVEDNQILAINRFLKCNPNSQAWFAINMNDETYFVNAEDILFLTERKTNLNYEELSKWGVKLDKWTL